MRSYLICLIGLGVTAWDANASRYCVEDWACAGVTERDKQHKVWVSNERQYPITMTLLVTTENLEDAVGQKGDFEITKVVPGNHKIPVLSLQQADPDERWRYHYSFDWSVGDMHAEHDDEYRYLVPYEQGAFYEVIQGYNGGFSHHGSESYSIDFGMPVGTPIHAARGGTVVDTAEHHNKGGGSQAYAQYANYVIVLHNDGTTGEYFHLMHQGVEVEVGQHVYPGELLGYSGNTGFSTTPHLHFAVYRARPKGDFESIPIIFKEGQRIDSY